MPHAVACALQIQWENKVMKTHHAVAMAIASFGLGAAAVQGLTGTESDLLAYYRLDEGGGEVLKNSAPQANMIRMVFTWRVSANAA